MAHTQSQSGVTLTIDISNLKKLREMFEKKVVIKTGIFAEDDQRPDGKSNVEIGWEHEFGNVEKRLPMRSWLRMPLFLKAKQIQDVANNAIIEGLKTGSFKDFYKKIAEECKHIVVEAFASGGYGNWKPIKDITAARKGNTRILRDHDYLMKAVKSKVVKT